VPLSSVCISTPIRSHDAVRTVSEGADVRRIVVSMWTTLDGYVADADDEMDWLAIDDQMMAYEISLVTHAAALVLGRVTHGDFADAWPRVARDHTEAPATRTYAQRVDVMPKVVVSRSGQIASWGGTSRLTSLDADAVAQLKEGEDGDLVVYGSLRVVHALQSLGAVDEYHLLVHPTAIGQGKALFAAPTRLYLRSVEAFSSGVSLMRYASAGEAD
jgi:dihydrofolate reductase